MKTALAILLLLLATAIGLVEALSIIDPTGTEMADDGDPWGDPRTPWFVHAANGGLIMASVGGAVLLLRDGRKTDFKPGPRWVDAVFNVARVEADRRAVGSREGAGGSPSLEGGYRRPSRAVAVLTVSVRRGSRQAGA